MLSTRRKANGNGAGCVGVVCEHTLGRQPLHLYGYLWAKPEFITDEKCGTFSFVVPDTVVFKQQKPVKWFFTSKQEKGKILAKSRKNLSTTHVLQAFSDATRQPGAQQNSEDETIVATYIYNERSSNGESVMVIEHLTPSAVHHLLTNREKPPLSVLQRFVPTRSGYNHLVQSVFTPDNCIVRKCVSSQLVSDTRLCIPLRTATFEADERHVKPRDVIKREEREHIEHSHLEMSNHLQKTIGKPIARQVVYFKRGSDGRLYLLWSTMLSFETGTLAFAKNLRLSLSQTDRIKYLAAVSTVATIGLNAVAPAAPSSSVQFKKCPSCKALLPSALVEFMATFKAILKAHEATQKDPLIPDPSSIPPILDEVLSPITEERFMELRDNPGFLYRTLCFCQRCAQTINTEALKQRQPPESSVILKSTNAVALERDKPIYMRSAHSIFWGKVARENATRQNEQSNPIQRPQSAMPLSRRPRNTRPAVERSAVAISHATWSRILPQLVADSSTATRDGPKHCMYKLAEHLQRAYGAPSIRLALARTNMFPGGSFVSLDALQWVCERKLLAEVFSYWTEICKAHGNDFNTNGIDVDALDALLTTFATTSETASMPARSRRPQSAAAITRSGIEALTVLDVHDRHHAPLLHPVRPAARTQASSLHRPASSRAARLSHSVEITPASKASEQSQPAEAVADKGTEATSIIKMIGDVRCQVDVTPVEDYAGGRCSLQVTAKAYDGTGISDASAGVKMQITLTTEQILGIISQGATSQSSTEPLSRERLTTLVLESLRIQNGALVVVTPPLQRSSSTEPTENSTATTNIDSVNDSAFLTPEELCVLRESLRGSP